MGRTLLVLAFVFAAAAGDALFRPSSGRGDHWPAAACQRYESLGGAADDGFGGRFLRGRSPLWSPSSQQIAVLRRPKVVVINVRTGRRSLVASIRSAALGLAWSPRGRHLAAFTENEIFIGAPPRPLRRIARGCFGAWSPSGRRFAFTADGWAQAANADGSQRRRVTRAAAVTDWSPEGGRLLLLRFAAREQCRTPASRAYVLRFGAGPAQPLTDHRFRAGESFPGHERGDQVAALFSPDGRRVLWPEGLACGVMVYDRSEPQTYVAGQPRSVGLGYATWSPSSHLVALKRKWSTTDPFIHDPVALVVEPGRRLVRELRGTSAYSWSPDGSQIAFDRYEDHVNLYVSRPDVPSSDRLLVRNGQVPAWSPDGSKIAFWRGTGIPRCSAELFVVIVRGGAPRKLLGC